MHLIRSQQTVTKARLVLHGGGASGRGGGLSAAGQDVLLVF